MGKAKRFNSYDESISQQRKTLENFGEARQKRSIGSSFRSSPLEPDVVTPISATSPCPAICTEHSLGNVSGTVDVDWRVAGFFRAVLTGDTILNFTNTPKTPKWQNVLVEVQQDATGGHSCGFAQVMNNGFVPNVITGANRYTCWQIYTYQEPSLTDVFQAFDKSGSQGPDVPGGGDSFQGFAGYGHFILSADQTTDIGINDHIEFDTVVDSENITVTAGTGQARGIFSGLRNGHTYELTAYLTGTGSGTTMNFAAQWYDRIAAAAIGTEGLAISVTETAHENDQHIAKAFFTAISSNSSLEVRITAATALSSITNGSTSTEGTCNATIKDCGVLESVINLPAPEEEGELDIKEFWFSSGTPNSTANRFGRIGHTINSNTTRTGQFDTMNKGGVIKAVIFNVINKGATDRDFQIQIDGVDVGQVFVLAGSTTGLKEFLNLNIPWETGDEIGLRTSGGNSSADDWNCTMTVWWL